MTPSSDILVPFLWKCRTCSVVTVDLRRHDGNDLKWGIMFPWNILKKTVLQQIFGSNIVRPTRMYLNSTSVFSQESWRRHQMETFSALLAIYAGNSPVPDHVPAQRPVTWSFDVFFDLRLNKRLSKQSWGWWFETLMRPLWRHCNADILMWHHVEEYHPYAM